MPPPAEGFASRFVLGPALRTQPDRRLVRLVRSGYETAFEEIVRRYGKPLGRYAAAIVGNRAEDVTQDAFSKALLALRRDGDAEIELRPWLYRIVRNTALNDIRDRPPTTQELAEVLESGSSSAAEDAERREEVSELMQRLQALPEPQRAAIVMRELEGLSHEEIAAALGMSGGAARQAIYRARRALRDGLGLLLPLPLLKALLAGGAAATGAEMASGAAGVGSAAGAGIGIKAAAATVLVAGTVGAGVALNDDRQGERSSTPTAPAAPSRDSSPAPLTSAPAPTTSDEGNGSVRGESGEDRGERERSDDDNGGPGSESGDHGGRSGPSGSSGPGSGEDRDDHSGSGSSGPSHRGSGSSGGSGSNSGPGSGGRDSGHESGGSSGPGSGEGSGSGPGSGGDDLEKDISGPDGDDSGSEGSSGSGSGASLPDDDSSGSSGNDGIDDD